MVRYSIKSEIQNLNSDYKSKKKGDVTLLLLHSFSYTTIMPPKNSTKKSSSAENEALRAQLQAAQAEMLRLNKALAVNKKGSSAEVPPSTPKSKLIY